MPSQIDDAVAILAAGGVVVYPTETSYGMGCDATNHTAVERIFAIKQRPVVKGLSTILPSLADATQYIILLPYTRRLVEYYWPGPLTIIAPKSPTSTLSPLCENGNNKTHAVRVSSHPVAAALANRLGKPIVATSANISGKSDVYDPADIVAAYGEGRDGPLGRLAHDVPDAYIDAGILPRTPPSTIVQVRPEGINVLRQGALVVRKVW